MRTIISASEIEEGVANLGQRLTTEFAHTDLVVIGVLKGSVVFLADLIRQMKIPLHLEFVRASSYRGEATTPGDLQLMAEELPSLEGRDVLLVDDIFDTGRTMQAIREQLRKQNPTSLRIAVLLWKTARREVEIRPDYFCFEIPDEFVVGYGLDFDGRYRHLPDVCVLDANVAESKP